MCKLSILRNNVLKDFEFWRSTKIDYKYYITTYGWFMKETNTFLSTIRKIVFLDLNKLIFYYLDVPLNLNNYQNDKL